MGSALVIVIVTAEDTPLMRAASVDDTGEFEFASLPIGTYHLEVKADDFQPLPPTDFVPALGMW